MYTLTWDGGHGPRGCQEAAKYSEGCSWPHSRERRIRSECVSWPCWPPAARWGVGGESSFCSSFPLHWIRAQLVLVFFNFHAGICLEKMWTRKSERNQGLERREMPLYTVQWSQKERENTTFKDIKRKNTIVKNITREDNYDYKAKIRHLNI